MEMTNKMPKLWNPAAETMDRGELAELQLDKLKRQLIRVYEQSPYYNAKFKKAGVDPAKLKSFADYQHFPFFDKDEERESQEDSKRQQGHPLGLHITCDIKQVNRLSSSSGTTGAPTFSGFTKADRDVTAENMARALVRIGIEPGDMVMHASVMSMWIAGLPILDAMLDYGACVIPVGALSGVERVAQIGVETHPKLIACTVSFAQHIVKTMKERTGVDPADLGIEKLVVFGEPGGSIPEIYKPIEAAFGGATVYDLMGATGCHSPTGIACEAHAGIHYFAEDNAHFEICDPETMQSLPLEDGVEGEIVYTGLDKECAPLIRWRDKDIIQVTMSPCECGRPGPRMTFKGRVDDMLLVRGVNVFPNAVRDVINKVSELTTGNMRIVKPGPEPVVPPPVPIKVEIQAGVPEERRRALADDLITAIRNQLRFRAEIEFIEEGQFELIKGTTGKTKLVEEAG